jgi:RNA polymerase sigma-70 factor (ECF subfamily)
MDDTLPAALASDLDAAFERLVRSHQDRLYTIALRLLGDPRDAEEVAQDAFVRAHRAIAGYPPERVRELRLRPWLATIVVNLCRNRARRHEPAVVRIDQPDAGDAGASGAASVAGSLRSLDPRDSPHDVAIRRDGARHWVTLLATLPDRYRTAVVLRHVDGLSYDEMATVLGRPEGTIKAQVHRGLAQLRAAAEEAARGELEEMTA